ncbi:hypothetical protein GF312_21020, partial [Candidatus Poribacteria bacterium]|nr:hypothetical protein [Candidatus Poribacteria bacterium]
LRPLTNYQPKEILPVGRKPVISYVIEEIRKADVENILIVTTKDKRIMEDCIEQEKSSTGEFFYVKQLLRDDMPYGLGYAIGLSEAFVSNEPFVVCLGDCIIKTGNDDDFLLKRMIETHEKFEAAATIAFEKVPQGKVSKYGVAKPLKYLSDGVFQLGDIVEKPDIDKAPSNMAVAARYVFEPDIFPLIRKTKPGKGGEIQITDAIKNLIDDKHPVYGVEFNKDEKRYDIGDFDGYFRAFFDCSINDESCGEDFKKYVQKRLLQSNNDQKTGD